MKKLSIGKWIGLSVIVILSIFVFINYDGLFVDNKATDILVVQYPFTGKLNFYFNAGAKWRFWGGVQIYPKSFQFWFDTTHVSGMGPITTRFADASSADITGGVRLTYPLIPEYMRGIHTKYGNHKAVESELINPIINKAFYNLGPLMTAQESYQSRRPDIIRLAQDMANIGVYQVISVPTDVIDPITQETKKIDKMVIVKDINAPGGLARQELSELDSFHIKASNMSISKIDYAPKVLEQIAEQQTAQMAVQTAIARSKAAIQNTIANIEEGKERATKAEWEQNVLKAKAIAKAEQLKAVAKLAMDAAEYTKAEQILLGEGEAKRKKLNMEADGLLGMRLQVFETVMGKVAESMGKYQGNWVPTIMMGGQGENSIGSANAYFKIIAAEAARNLGISFDMSKTNPVTKPVTKPTQK